MTTKGLERGVLESYERRLYIMTNESHRTLYVGMSSNLPVRVDAHKNDINEGFTQRYKCHKLVYYEGCDDVDQAYKREKQIKGWTRLKKVALINNTSATWRDLFEDLINDCT